jgi:hypothetical protein
MVVTSLRTGTEAEFIVRLEVVRVLKVETVVPVKGRPLIELTVRVLKVETVGPPLPVKGRPLIELTVRVLNVLTGPGLLTFVDCPVAFITLRFPDASEESLAAPR